MRKKCFYKLQSRSEEKVYALCLGITVRDKMSALFFFALFMDGL